MATRKTPSKTTPARKRTTTTRRKPAAKSNGAANGAKPKAVAVEKEVPQVEEPSIKFSELAKFSAKKDILEILEEHGEEAGEKIAKTIRYETELALLQAELIKMQRWVQEKGKRVAIIFEGRDAAGKGGNIRRFTMHLNPRAMRVVALPKPTEMEKGQWYFQRYVKQLPNKGEIVFFDRSWYNRAVVEPVNGFCSTKEYNLYMRQVPEFEHMLYEDGIIVIKFWFSISKEEQLARFESRKTNALKLWKISPVDMKAQELWDTYTRYKEEMFSKTHNSFSPWIIVKANKKKKARLETIRYVLSMIPYKGKDESKSFLLPDPNTTYRYHRKIKMIDD